VAFEIQFPFDSIPVFVFVFVALQGVSLTLTFPLSFLYAKVLH